MRVLAIDLGAKRIGTAVSDGLGLTVRPLRTLARAGDTRDLAQLKSMVEELGAEAVVVGLPLRLDGTEGDAAIRAKRFAERLGAELSIPVYTHDERLTSFEADQMMIELGIKAGDRRARVDQVAAAIILRDFLSVTRNKAE